MRPAPKILVVEDEFLIAMELDDTLCDAGFEVLGPVSNVNAALALLRNERPDGAVLDVSVAGEWVTPVAEMLRTMAVPFILTSSYGADILQATPVLRGAVNVGKLSRSVQVVTELRRVLGDRRLPPTAR